MNGDQQLHEKACTYLQAMLDETENYEETLRYFVFLREAIDQYLGSLEEGDDDYPCLQ